MYFVGFCFWFRDLIPQPRLGLLGISASAANQATLVDDDFPVLFTAGMASRIPDNFAHGRRLRLGFRIHYVSFIII